VSWNGATEVAKWRLEAASPSAPMEDVSIVVKRGFETMIDFSRQGATEFEVAALDGSGRVIARSATVTAT
jgi:hypothetical protein